jgi:hypothetical protein
MALQRGGADNTTVVAVFLEGAEEASAQPLKRVKLLLAKVVEFAQKFTGKIGG